MVPQASAWISSASRPYSSAYSTRSVPRTEACQPCVPGQRRLRVLRDRRPENEPATFSRDYAGDPHSARRSHRALSLQHGIREQRRNVPEENPRLRKVGDVADRCANAGQPVARPAADSSSPYLEWPLRWNGCDVWYLANVRDLRARRTRAHRVRSRSMHSGGPDASSSTVPSRCAYPAHASQAASPFRRRTTESLRPALSPELSDARRSAICSCTRV